MRLLLRTPFPYQNSRQKLLQKEEVLQFDSLLLSIVSNDIILDLVIAKISNPGANVTTNNVVGHKRVHGRRVQQDSSPAVFENERIDHGVRTCPTADQKSVVAVSSDIIVVKNVVRGIVPNSEAMRTIET